MRTLPLSNDDGQIQPHCFLELFGQLKAWEIDSQMTTYSMSWSIGFFLFPSGFPPAYVWPKATLTVAV